MTPTVGGEQNAEKAVRPGRGKETAARRVGRPSARGSSARKTSITSRGGYRSGHTGSTLKGSADSPQELTFESTGRTFIYRLDFDGPDGDILGVYRILKPPQAKKPEKKSIPPPTWRLIGKSITGGFGFTDSYHFSHVPNWVQNKIVKFKSGTVTESVYRLKGRKFRYKVVFDYKGQGVLVTEVYRRPRTWFWKKLKAKP